MQVIASISDTQAQAISGGQAPTMSGGLKRPLIIKNITQVQQQLEQSNLAVSIPTTGGILGGVGTSDLIGGNVVLFNQGSLNSTINNLVSR